MLKIDRDFAGSQHTGARPYQEDSQGFASLAEDDEGNVTSLLIILADGMGGENAGDIASQLVVQTCVDYCLAHYDPTGIPEMLRGGMLAANDSLTAAIEKDSSLDGMGATLLSVVIQDDSLYWLSVGDSPLYLYRDGALKQINEDHSMIPVLQDRVERGEIKNSELEKHPERNVLRSAIIGEEVELVDCPETAITLKPKDAIIAASDGLQTLDEEAICLRLNRHQGVFAEYIVQKLLTAVERINNPKQDNVSINMVIIPAANRELTSVDEEERSKTRILFRKQPPKNIEE